MLPERGSDVVCISEWKSCGCLVLQFVFALGCVWGANYVHYIRVNVPLCSCRWSFHKYCQTEMMQCHMSHNLHMSLLTLPVWGLVRPACVFVWYRPLLWYGKYFWLMHLWRGCCWSNMCLGERVRVNQKLALYLGGQICLMSCCQYKMKQQVLMHLYPAIVITGIPVRPIIVGMSFTYNFVTHDEHVSIKT